MENTQKRPSGKRPKKRRFRGNQITKVCAHTNVAEGRDTGKCASSNKISGILSLKSQILLSVVKLVVALGIKRLQSGPVRGGKDIFGEPCCGGKKRKALCSEKIEPIIFTDGASGGKDIFEAMPHVNSSSEKESVLLRKDRTDHFNGRSVRRERDFRKPCCD
ncbi:hypothetical protein TNCV_3300231 [Trichonephila clavipes]|nr:hypothetical protein TNCV_3300231 [Trichonephila clavipes]